MTIPAVLLLFLIITPLLPVLFLLGVIIDIYRAGRHATPWMANRILAFGWWYLLGEVWAIIALALVGLLPERRSIDATYRLQEMWTIWNLQAVRILFGLTFSVSGAEACSPGPIILLSRHASLIDSLLPATFVSRPYGLKLRYVLKKELLTDPALDIAGNRLPNYFIDRKSANFEGERAAIRNLVSELTPVEGVLIYPGG